MDYPTPLRTFNLLFVPLASLGVGGIITTAVLLLLFLSIL